ncbi:MAG TPA: Hsp20/alpha crystallin family protein [Alphaproteobacteria bacterium]|jgi:HSP20 family protein|nr:Hsp20/alpha crystallin family protein [Alphaproteobacteria bacterium]
MAIIRFDPFRNDLNFFDSYEDWPELTLTQGLNIYEESDHVVVKAAVPGIPEDKLTITYEDGVLTIKGRVEETEEEKSKNKVTYKKQMISSVDYTSYLPRAVDAEKIEAEVSNGIVTIKAPIAETAKPKRIPVKSVSKK